MPHHIDDPAPPHPERPETWQQFEAVEERRGDSNASWAPRDRWDSSAMGQTPVWANAERGYGAGVCFRWRVG